MADSSERDLLPVVELKVDGSPSATARLQVAMDGQQLRLAITVPTEPLTLSQMLPVLQGFTNAVVSIAESKVAEAGEQISCKAGCGACCRQVVPISPSEAHAIQRLVQSLPEPRRQAVEQRFADAIQRLQEAGLLESLRTPNEEVNEDELATDYFRLGIACPFLEDESCSIHRDRPLACREYLVTSPPAECSRPSGNNVRCVPMPAKASWALRAVDWDSLPLKSGWLPLVLSLEWSEAYPEPDPCPGPQWMQHYFRRLEQSRE